MLLALVTEKTFEEDIISSVAFEPSIGDVANDGDQSDSKIEGHVCVHLTNLQNSAFTSMSENTM